MPAHTVGRMGGSAFASKKSAAAAAHSQPEKSKDTTIHTHTVIQNVPILPTYSYMSQPIIPSIYPIGVAPPIDFSFIATFIAMQIVLIYIVNRKA